MGFDDLDEYGFRPSTLTLPTFNIDDYEDDGKESSGEESPDEMASKKLKSWWA